MKWLPKRSDGSHDGTSFGVQDDRFFRLFHDLQSNPKCNSRRFSIENDEEKLSKTVSYS